VMTKERTSNERFEIVGLTKAEVDRCMEVLCGGPMPWDRGYCFASSELFARPSRYDDSQHATGAVMTNDRCINWPCAKGAGHAGPCGTSPPPSRIGPTEPDDTMVICP